MLGSFITRKNRGSPFPVPTLTLTGALDGLTRVSRVAESYYHEVLHAADEGANRFVQDGLFANLFKCVTANWLLTATLTSLN